MQLVNTWKRFFESHPDREELEKRAAEITTFFNPSDPVDINLAKLTATNSLLMLSLDPFLYTLSPTFFHYRIGMPFEGIPPRLVSLTEFSDRSPILAIDPNTFFTETADAIPTPSIESYLSFHDKSLNQLQSITPTEGSNSRIRLAAPLPPSLAISFINISSTITPWEMLHLAIQYVENKRPVVLEDNNDEASGVAEEENEENNLTFALPFLSLLNTLWAFTRSTAATQAIGHPLKSITNDIRALQWSKTIHHNHIPNPTSSQSAPPSSSQLPPDASELTRSVQNLTQTIADSNNTRFAAGDDDKSESPSKQWKKFDEMRQKIILFASTTDGFSPAAEPTTRLLQLTKVSGPTAAGMLTSWHSDLSITPGMATNITKGILKCNDNPFAVNTFSIFYTPYLTNLLLPLTLTDLQNNSRTGTSSSK